MFINYIFLLSIVKISSSTWLACVDYIEKNGEYWNPNLCRGYPRDGSTMTPKNEFGVDKGLILNINN